jgi:hypothetical protein
MATYQGRATTSNAPTNRGHCRQRFRANHANGAASANGTSAFAQAQAAETELLTDLRRADAQLTLADFNGESPAIQQLALKVLRLEAELAQRRLS